MKFKLYNFLVNKHIGIRLRYQKIKKDKINDRKVLSWIYLIWLNFAYYILCCRFLGVNPEVSIFEEKNLEINNAESFSTPNVEEYLDRLEPYEYISFDIFDTLIFRPFSEPTDLFYLLGEKINYMDFKRLRMIAEHEARLKKFQQKGTYEVKLFEIWKMLEKMSGINAQDGQKLEEELELKVCYANPFMKQVFDEMQKRKKKIIIISDMYLSEKVLEKMLSKNGYVGYEKLFVSCETEKNKGSGALFQLVKKELGISSKKIIHIGDNEGSDVIQAKKQGFASCYYPNVNKKTIINRSYDMSPIIGGAYRGIVNNQLYSGNIKYSMEYEYGFIYGGLFVLGYCNFIQDYCKKNKIDKVLFLSRDGEILKSVYNYLYPNDKTEYVYWSRKAATKLEATYDKYDFFRRFVYHKVNQGYSILEIFSAMELDFLSSEIVDLKETDLLTDKNCNKVRKFIETKWDKVIKQYSIQHKAAKNYYEQILKDVNKAVAVDIGWAGSGAMVLRYLVSNEWKIPSEIIGIIAGTNTLHNAEPDASETFLQSGKLVSYLYSQSHNRDLLKKHDPNKNYNVFWELLLSSPTPQFVGFDLDEKNEILFHFGKYDENQEGIKEIQSGIMDFVKEYDKHFKEFSYMYEISGRDAYAPMLVAASHQEKYLKEIEKRFHLEINVN